MRRLSLWAARRSAESVLLAISLVALASCSGGGGSPAANSGGTPGGGAGSTSSSRGTVTFDMTWASSSAANSWLRRPQYLAPTALSVSITVVSAPAPWTSATPIIEVLNNPSSTITFSAPTGQDTFLIQTYDEQNALGNVLSKAFVTQTVSGTSANVVSAILNGVVASLTLNVSPLQPVGGTASTMTVSSTGYDADGNVIVGPGTYASPIQLTIVDPSNSGALSLANTVLQQPGAMTTLAYNGKPLVSASLVAGVTGVTAYASVTIAPTPGATFYTLPTGNSAPSYIAVDSSNNLWITEANASRIAELPTGSTTFLEYPTTTANSYPQGITYGSDGRIWFAEYNSNKIGAITSAGVITEYSTLFGGSDHPIQLVDRGDGNMWYTGYGADHIGYQRETSGAGGETTLPESPTQVNPDGIAPAADGYIYFTENGNSKIGRLHDLLGAVQEISLPAVSGSCCNVSPGPMVTGPDGNLWFTDANNAQIGRVNIPAFTVTFFPTASPGSGPLGITVGPDGALWYTESNIDKIGRMTTSGAATDYSLGATGLGLTGIAVRSNGVVWFCARNTNQIGKLVI